MLNQYEQRKAEKIERRKARAEKLAKESDRLSGAAWQSLQQIPPGQPILVGHHSERHHRNHLAKVDGMMRKSVELDKKAKYAAQAAEASESRTDIDSDDPDAPGKIRERIAELEKSQNEMKQINAAWRKVGRPDPDGDDEAWEKMAKALPDADIPKTRRNCAVVQKFGMFSQPFAPYSLSLNSANIARLKKRLEEIEKVRELHEPEESRTREYGRVTVRVDPDAGRVFFETPGRNERATEILRGRGWCWSRREGCWSRKLTANAIAAAKMIGPSLAEVYAD